jgi:hypothetical protein
MTPMNMIYKRNGVPGMLSMVKALQLFKRERSVVDRERSHKKYTAGEYLLSKLFAELPLDAAIGAVSLPY